ncbi:MAG TPA: RNA 2',3'-cyclic phosphodiesterase, partial [Pirellulales bacterium]
MRRRVRTFVAIELPAEVRRRACQLIEALRRSSDTDVRWVTPEQLHWTLKFLGDVDLLEIPEICRRLSAAVAPLAPFDVAARGAGAFPDALHPRTVWIGMREGLEPMLALHQTVEDVLADL